MVPARWAVLGGTESPMRFANRSGAPNLCVAPTAAAATAAPTVEPSASLRHASFSVPPRRPAQPELASARRSKRASSSEAGATLPIRRAAGLAAAWSAIQHSRWPVHCATESLGIATAPGPPPVPTTTPAVAFAATPLAPTAAPPTVPPFSVPPAGPPTTSASTQLRMMQTLEQMTEEQAMELLLDDDGELDILH